MKRIVHYINQFYGQIGGEEKADLKPLLKEGPVGPGLALGTTIGEDGEIVATIICGDNYFADNQDDALTEILDMMAQYAPDMVIAGPGFNAGRYGLACGAVCDAAKKRFNIPVVTALYPENPGAEMYHKTVYILETPISAAGMKKVASAMGKFIGKLLRGDEIGFPEEEGYIPQGFRVNFHTEKNGAERGVDMLMKKMRGEPFVTELPMPVFDRVPPAPAVTDLSQIKIALVTSGGIVPNGDLEITLHDDGEIAFSNTTSELNEIQVGKLFDRFFTVEAARKSGGLGLAISRTLVEQMGGSICAELSDHVLSIQIRFL